MKIRLMAVVWYGISIHWSLGKTFINCVSCNKEIKNVVQGINADRWRRFPGGKHRKLIKNQMMREVMQQKGDPFFISEIPPSLSCIVVIFLYLVIS